MPFEKNQTVEIQAVGAGSLNQAIKAIAIARGYVAANWQRFNLCASF